jgi:hypothetical protein
MIVYWPEKLLKPQTISVDLAHRNLRSPSAASGFTQVVSNSAGIWKVSFSNIPVYSAQMIKCWRAIDTLIEGQLFPLSIPVFDHPRSPSSTDNYGRNLYNFYNSSTSHSDGTFFSDGSGYSSTWTRVFATTAGTVGATTISVLKSPPLATLEPGQRFSVNDRLYQIQKITAQTDTTATFTVRPPIREAFSIGTRLEFDNPRVRVKLLSDTAMNIPLNFNQQTFPTLDFIEDL